MKCITVAENGRTPVDPAALTWTVFMGLRTYEIARITEDRSTGKWRRRDEVLGDREEAVSKVEKLLPGLLMLAIHKAMAPPLFELHGSVDDTPIYKMDDEDGWDIFTLGKLLDLGRAISYRRDNFFGLLPPAHRKKRLTPPRRRRKRPEYRSFPDDTPETLHIQVVLVVEN